MSHAIDQWKGDFGNSYHERQNELYIEVGKRQLMWSQVLTLMSPRGHFDILEVGAGMGVNIEAIRLLNPDPHLFALEPNVKARRSLNCGHTWGTAEAIDSPDKAFDLAFTYGVLIHLPDPLPAMREMYRVSRRFVMCAEYFSPKREAIPYRDGVPLFKDDYGGLWMDNFNVKLLGYGFCWKRATGLDNVTWWLFEKIM